MSKVRLNEVILGGFVGGARVPDTGNVITLSLGVDSSYFKRDPNGGDNAGEWVNNTDYIRVKNFNPSKITKYKELVGADVIVKGTLKTNNYKDSNGTTIYETFVLAENIQLVSMNEEYHNSHPVNGSYNGGGDANYDQGSSGTINLDGIEDM